jgi:hypothetical protein
VAVVLARDQLPMPRQQRVGAHDRDDVVEHPPRQSLRFGGQPNALIVGEAQPPRAELLSEHVVLFLEIVDHVALLRMDPAGNATSRNRNGCDCEDMTRRYRSDPTRATAAGDLTSETPPRQALMMCRLSYWILRECRHRVLVSGNRAARSRPTSLSPERDRTRHGRSDSFKSSVQDRNFGSPDDERKSRTSPLVRNPCINASWAYIGPASDCQLKRERIQRPASTNA